LLVVVDNRRLPCNLRSRASLCSALARHTRFEHVRIFFLRKPKNDRWEESSEWMAHLGGCATRSKSGPYCMEVGAECQPPTATLVDSQIRPIIRYHIPRLCGCEHRAARPESQTRTVCSSPPPTWIVQGRKKSEEFLDKRFFRLSLSGPMLCCRVEEVLPSNHLGSSSSLPIPEMYFEPAVNHRSPIIKNFLLRPQVKQYTSHTRSTFNFRG
jgi:hypothetical protein